MSSRTITFLATDKISIMRWRQAEHSQSLQKHFYIPQILQAGCKDGKTFLTCEDFPGNAITAAELISIDQQLDLQPIRPLLPSPHNHQSAQTWWDRYRQTLPEDSSNLRRTLNRIVQDNLHVIRIHFGLTNYQVVTNPEITKPLLLNPHQFDFIPQRWAITDHINPNQLDQQIVNYLHLDRRAITLNYLIKQYKHGTLSFETHAALLTQFT